MQSFEPTDLSAKISAWHAYTGQEVLERLGSGYDGLSQAEVAKRQVVYGANSLPGTSSPSLAAVFLHQFKSPLIYILLGAACLSILIGDLKDAAFICIVILSNAAIGTFQEYRAEKSAAALQKLIKVMAHVKRAAKDQNVASEELVPGDIVRLESGSRVPADLRLLQSNDLYVDESLLTGESLVVEKNTSAQAIDTVLSERVNMAFAGSTVASGRAMGVVVATGAATEVGKIAKTVSETSAAKPPLVIRMERFARKISYVVLGACLLLLIFALLRNIPFSEVFFLAVALAVSAIPEGLPIALTVALSVASARMAKRHVVVRRLAAVESLGSCTLIASDKTGTLTVNQQTAKSIVLPTGQDLSLTGQGYNGEGQVRKADETALESAERLRLGRLAQICSICNEASLSLQDGQWQHQGDAIDVAFLALVYKLGLNPEELRSRVSFIKDIPFESQRRYAATVFQEKETLSLAVKGAPEAILPHCRWMQLEQPGPIDSQAMSAKAQALAENGYRVLAVAEATLQDEAELRALDPDALPVLTLLALVAFIDPLRPEAKDAIATCHRAGVKVIMITGDHPSTAFAIAKELGISHEAETVLTGQQLEVLYQDPKQFAGAVEQARVFARVSPLQKLQIVESLGKLGHFVAVTGDGVNDAPAMRKASIGIAMGSGSDVAKDTAVMILSNDNFSSIVSGIEEGRYAYDNIRKVSYLLISTGFSEVLIFLLAVIFGLPLPFLAVQLLWLNLVTNGIQDVALAFEKGEAGAMLRPPRKPKESIVNSLMLKESFVAGLTMTGISFTLWYWLLANGWQEASARNVVVLLMVLLQNVHVFNCRSEYLSAFRIPLKHNLLLLLGVVVAQGLHILAMHIPFMQSLLRLEPLSLQVWFMLLLLAFGMLMVMELFKYLNFRHMRKNTQASTGL